MAQLSLTQCDTLVFHDYAELATQLSDLLASWHLAKPVVVFPGEGAVEIHKAQVPMSTPLLFIDDTWRKAKRLFHEVPLLQSLTKVSLPSYCSGAYGVRSAKKHAINSQFNGSQPLSSLEAVAYSLSILEGRAEYYQPMLATLEWLVEKQSTELQNS
jgi:DTW domain-containing protein YfiP